jgi:hypothetical protein
MLAKLEIEIGRISDPGQTGKKVLAGHGGIYLSSQTKW